MIKKEKFTLHPQTITEFNFQPSPTKPDNQDHPTIKTAQV